MSDRLINALQDNQGDFGVDLNPRQMESIVLYSELIELQNPLLHLIGPCTAEEFAVRHILESVFVLRLLAACRKFADIGSGAGLPGIACLIANPGLKGVLIESKPKKAEFLKEAVNLLGLRDRARVINRQFEEVKNPGVDYVFCRALDKFKAKIPALIRWSGNAVPVLFAGPAVRDELARLGIEHTETLIPHSERRYVLTIAKRGDRRVPRSLDQIQDNG